MNKYGIHLANGAQDIQRIVSCGFTHYLALEMQVDYLAQCPGERYLRLWNKPGDDAIDIADGIRDYLGITTDIIPWNEANIETDLSYAEIAACFNEVCDVIDGDVTLHWPALSPSRYYQAYVAHWLPAAERADVVDVHCYGTCEEMLEIVDWYRRVLPGKPLLITEFNFGAGRQVDPNWWAQEALRFYAALYERPEVMAACGFIWKWYNPDIALPTTVDWQDQPIEAVVRAALKTDVGGVTMSLRDQFPELFSQWEAAGGGDNNFRSHLLAVGALKPTKDDVRFLAEELNSKAQQIINVVNALPFA